MKRRSKFIFRAPFLIAGALSRPLKEICLLAFSYRDIVSHQFKRKLLCDWKLFMKQRVYIMCSGFKKIPYETGMIV